jgi:hypothetical protein
MRYRWIESLSKPLNGIKVPAETKRRKNAI